MINLEMAPQSGICYALYSDREVVFEKYSSGITIDETNLLELHLFDQEKEFRAIRTEAQGFIVTVVTDADYKHDDIYEEQVFTEKGWAIKVVNYITYNDYDLLNIDNYRFKEV